MAPAVDFGEGREGCRVEFHGGLGTSLVRVRLDAPEGICAGTVACAPEWGKKTSASWGGISRQSGIHDVYFTTEGDIAVAGITFTEESPFASAHYISVPQDRIEDTRADTWEAVDELGRRVRSCEDVGRKKEKKVGLFYWTWRDANSDKSPVSITKTLRAHPAAEYNLHHPAWGENPSCHWDEPLYGYYRSTDPYVIRKHAALLADAGIDFVLLDCTNGSILWKEGYTALFEGFRQARADGIRAPQIGFMLNFGPVRDTLLSLLGLYQDLYRPGLYSDLWFMLDGKPFIMAYPESIPNSGGGEYDTRTLHKIRDFFTFRPGQPLYRGGPSRPDHWGWLEACPQNKYGPRPDGGCEMVTVGVGQNMNDDIVCTHFNNQNTYGRSHTAADGNARLTPDSYKYGRNVQEQWDRALDLDPDIIFITGWNEWTSGMWGAPWIQDPHSPQVAFVDEFDREHSRDIEFDRDGIRDSFYLQMASNIRRFKGALPRPAASAEKTIDLAAGFGQWREVTPDFRSNRGTAVNRDWPGFGGLRYRNRTARNDILLAKVARDGEYLYFYVRTKDALTKPAGAGWMNLFLNVDRRRETGWEGFDFLLNRSRTPNGRLSVEKNQGGFRWKKTGEADYAFSGNELHLRVPRRLLGLSDTLDFEFKWSDNLQNPDPMDFYENGDTAPLGRFNFRFLG